MLAFCVVLFLDKWRSDSFQKEGRFKVKHPHPCQSMSVPSVHGLYSWMKIVMWANLEDFMTHSHIFLIFFFFSWIFLSISISSNGLCVNDFITASVLGLW